MLVSGVILAFSASLGALRWTLTSSTASSSGSPSCSITDGGNCITDGDGPYESNENCIFRAEASFYIDATQFDLEDGFDFITLTNGNAQYTGSVGPNNVLLHPGDFITFASDYSVVANGFKICATVVFAQPPSPPPNPPTAPGALFTFDNDPGVGWSTGTTDPSNGAALSSPPYGFNWREGSTPSSDTGPSSGFGGSGKYYYAEASSPRIDGDVFQLLYDGSACGGSSLIKDVTFGYHMFGASMGSLALVDGGGKELWKVSGQQSAIAIGDWKFATGTSAHYRLTRGPHICT